MWKYKSYAYVCCHPLAFLDDFAGCLVLEVCKIAR